MKIETFWDRKIKAPLIGAVKQGLTGEKLALGMALGLTISISPLVFGITTLLCATVAYVLRLNQIVVQVGNYLALPIQLLLMGPFMIFAEKIFLGTETDISPATLRQFIEAGPHAFFIKFGSLFLWGSLLWLLISPVVAGILYIILLKPMRKFAARYASEIKSVS